MVEKVAQKKIIMLAAGDSGIAKEGGVTAETALSQLAVGRAILSNNDWDAFFSNEQYVNNYRKLHIMLAAWTGTMVAYAEPGKELGKTVELSDAGLTWAFPVPGQYQNERNACLVVEHPHFSIKAEGNRRVVVVDDEKNVMIVRDFPEISGWYAVSPEGIPFGKDVYTPRWYLPEPGTRYLTRGSRMVSLVVRDGSTYDGNVVNLGREPSGRYGLAVDAGILDEFAVNGEGDEKTIFNVPIASKHKKPFEVNWECGRLVVTGPAEQLEKVQEVLKGLLLE